jgi:hypothetical protein
MILIWTDPARPDHQQEHAHDLSVMSKLLHRIGERARAAGGTPLAVQLYAGDRYPRSAHWEGTRHMPDDPGDGPRPELLLTLGAARTPLYWTAPDGSEYASKGPSVTSEPEFEYLYGGQPSYAPASMLVPVAQALDAVTEFFDTNGLRPAGISWQQDTA